MGITIKPLSPEILNDYLFFFDNITFVEHPHWSACYCFSFHFTGTSEQWNRESNRSSVITYINEGRMKGYLAYDNSRPVGWCNVNDKSNYQSLAKYYELTDSGDDKVCSVVCFLIHPDYRRKGIAQSLLQSVSEDYALRKYDYIEAYPGKGNLSCEGYYPGPVQLYLNNGFHVYKEYDKHFVVRKRFI